MGAQSSRKVGSLGDSWFAQEVAVDISVGLRVVVVVVVNVKKEGKTGSN